MPRIFSLLLGLFAIVAGGCVPISKSPLSDPSAARVDHQLLGKWTSPDGTGAEMEFRKSDLKDAPPGLMMVHTTKGLRDPNSPEVLHFFVTKTGQIHFANVLFVKPENAPLESWEAGRIDGYLICPYAISERGLEYGIFADEKIVSLIREGHLIGSVEELSNGRQTWIRDTSADLLALVSRKDSGSLFTKTSSELRRVK